MIALHELLSCERAGHVPVCRDDEANQTIDFAAFRARVFAIALQLRETPAHRYALCIDDPFDFACALFALFACGKTPVIPANATPGYLADLADAYDAVLTGADVRAHAATQACAETPLKIDPNAPLTLYTSGSSGTPVGAGSTWRAIGREISQTSRLTIGHSTRRAPPGSLSGGRSTIAE